MEDKNKKNKEVVIGLVVFGIIFWIVMSMIGGSSDNTPNKYDQFGPLSRARFDQIKSESLELNSIDCLSTNCDDVVIFKYNKLPGNVETIIRGNAATFSKFKLDNLGVSHVSVSAEYNGRTIFSCRASSGKVDSCE